MPLSRDNSRAAGDDLRTVAAELGHGRSTSAIVAEALRRMIRSGGLSAGHRLAPERDLATSLDTSRATVRAALHELAAQGLIEIRKGRAGGAVVIHNGTQTPARLRGDIERGLRESEELRLAIEPMVAALAAQRASSDQRNALVALSRQPTPSLATYQAADHAFHLMVASASENRPMRRALEEHFAEFFAWANTAFLNATTFEALSDFPAMHAQLAKVIATGDHVRARADMASHVRCAYSQWHAAFGFSTNLREPAQDQDPSTFWDGHWANNAHA